MHNRFAQLLRASADDVTAGGNRRYGQLASRIADFLLAQQVVAEDCAVHLTADDANARSGVVTLRLLRGSHATVDVTVRLQRVPRASELWLEGHRSKVGPLRPGEFFRVTLDGRVGARPGFHGWSSGHNLGPDAQRVAPTALSPSAPWRAFARFKAYLKRVPALGPAILRVQKSFEGAGVSPDLSDVEGVTFRFVHVSRAGDVVELEAYDRGGFYDALLNAEGRQLPPQVPGNYYADAYAALTFAWLYVRTRRTEYLEASHIALEFARRVYRQYAPTDFVWHHSDFKNPALIETVETLASQPGAMTVEQCELWRRFFATLQEDAYSPTNVFALRMHWRSARAVTMATDESTELQQCLQRLQEDQTSDGLFHDNAPTYPDAHDLTYHQYTLACLARSLAWRHTPDARAAFLKGVRFSLQLTTPSGELAYVGRGAHNVYHVASAILAFEAAARLEEVAENERAQLRRGACLLLGRLERAQYPSGMLPTAMNPLVTQRVAWNHCETPYNALVASLLLNASAIADESAPHLPLPMEQDGTQVFDESGFATATAGPLFFVVFSGCAESYPWSEGKHRTGVAGLAQFGTVDRGPLLPILDHATTGGDPVVSDLPVIDGKAPYGRGRLSVPRVPFPSLLLEHAYGGATLCRLYLLTPQGLLVFTTVSSAAESSPRVDGLVAMPVLCNDGWRLRSKEGRALSSGPSGAIETYVLFTDNAQTGRPRLSPVVTNPRGLARRVELARSPSGSRSPSTVRAVHLLWPHGEGSDAVPVPRVRFDGEAYLLDDAGGQLRVRTDDGVEIAGTLAFTR